MFHIPVVSQDPGCPMTKWFLCAVDGWNKNTTTQDQRVNYLICWDDSVGTDEMRTRKCAKQVGLDFGPISECQSGTKGNDLQLAAAEYFEKRFPDHAHTGIFGVPHVFINGYDIGTDRSYDDVLKQLCATGIKAGACN